MNSTTTCSPETRAAYTTARSDLLALVPESARRILEIGCSDGTLGAAIKQRGDPGTYITGIEANIQLANTAPIAPHNCSRGSDGKSRPSALAAAAL